MSAATDFLTGWFAKAQVRAPSITRVSCQRWPGGGTGPNFKPGIGSYGWGINGVLQKDSSGNPASLRFGGIHVWFSDRGQDLSQPPPAAGQQFLQSASDSERMTFSNNGDQVQLLVESITWGGSFTATTTMVDIPSQQLVFSNMPAAGPDPVRSLLVVAFADTGQFAWL